MNEGKDTVPIASRAAGLPESYYGPVKTLRDEFAIIALEVLMGIAEHAPKSWSASELMKATTASAYAYADAMMEARKRV